MPDPRDPRGAMHHPHPSSHGYPGYPGPGYPPSSSAPPYHHPTARHIPNGPPPPPAPGPPHHPPPMAMGGPPPESIAPPPPPPPAAAPMGNGHGHGPLPIPAGSSPTVRKASEDMDALMGKLAHANENTWMLIGAVAEQMNDQDRALAAFENALRHNPNSILGLNAVASIMRGRDNFDKAIEYFQRILNIRQDNGEVWGSMGHCLLMKDDLPKAYTAYQQALYHLPNPKEPKLWYGIGILYDRYGSFEHAEEAFTSVLKMDPNFEKANEIYFRLGIIYKHQRKYQQSLECFRFILNNPPRPLTSWDIWFQLGHVYEQDHDYESARDAYMRVLTHQPDHAKVLQQLGWLYHQPGAPFADQDKAVSYLTKSLETDGNDAQSWYLLGRAFMAGQRYNKAYEAYQQAVYRDGRNPTFWCSIGVLYYQINQYRDALDAYSRAIRLNPYISEVWYNLGSLYESCNNQITDAIDAYSRAAELDPTNPTIKQRLGMLQAAGSTNAPLPPAPGPVDVHPSQYSATPSGPYAPGASPGGSPRGTPGQMPDIRPDGGLPAVGRDLPPVPPNGDFGRSHSPGPFRGAPVPPPLNHVDESRGNMSRHAPLAPIDTHRPDGLAPRDPRETRDPYREAPFNGNGRYDPVDARPLAESPGSPRRREAYPGYPYPPSAGYRESRDRDEWERRERDRRQGLPGPPDPRGPSPRMHDRVPGPPPPMAIDRRPSPRLPPAPEYRDYPRPPGEPSYPYYPSERGYPPGPDPRDRERYDPRREEERRRFEEREREREFKPEGGLAVRHPSMPREFRADNPRAPSPALSTSSRASKRARESEGITKPSSSTKKVKEDKESEREKPSSRKSETTPKSTAIAKDREQPPSSPAGSAVSGTPVPVPRQPARRAVDEDYDEGAADALMFLHGDRPAPAPANGNGNGVAAVASATSSPTRPPVEEAPSPVTGSKRTEPPSPTSPGSLAKKAKSDEDEAAASPVRAAPSPPKGRTVIEVLNNPRAPSPPRESPAAGVRPASSEPIVTDDKTAPPIPPAPVLIAEPTPASSKSSQDVVPQKKPEGDVDVDTAVEQTSTTKEASVGAEAGAGDVDDRVETDVQAAPEADVEMAEPEVNKPEDKENKDEGAPPPAPVAAAIEVVAEDEAVGIEKEAGADKEAEAEAEAEAAKE